MNVEIEIAEWLAASHDDIATGTNLFIGDLPADTLEGIIVGLNRHLQSFDSMSRANIQIFLLYHDYVEGRNLMQEITDILDAYRGTNEGAWAVAGEVYGDGLGKDVKNRNVFSIEFEAAYKEG